MYLANVLKGPAWPEVTTPVPRFPSAGSGGSESLPEVIAVVQVIDCQDQDSSHPNDSGDFEDDGCHPECLGLVGRGGAVFLKGLVLNNLLQFVASPVFALALEMICPRFCLSVDFITLSPLTTLGRRRRSELEKILSLLRTGRVFDVLRPRLRVFRTLLGS